MSKEKIRSFIASSSSMILKRCHSNQNIVNTKLKSLSWMMNLLMAWQFISIFYLQLICKSLFSEVVDFSFSCRIRRSFGSSFMWIISWLFCTWEDNRLKRFFQLGSWRYKMSNQNYFPAIPLKSEGNNIKSFLLLKQQPILCSRIFV